MRTLLNAIIVVVIPVAEFVAFRRIGLTGAGGIFLIFVTLAVLMVWAVKADGRANELRLQKGAASFGFLPAGRDDVPLSIEPLSGNGWIAAAAAGELRGLQAWIFDYCIPDRGSAESQRNVNQTVVAFRVDDANLPKFQIRPLDSSTSIFDRPRWQSFDGDWENSNLTLCFPDAQQFHQRFEMMSIGEEGVRQLFNAKLLDTIAALNDCNCVVKANYTTVLFFTPDKILRPAEYEAFARKGADVAYAIFSAEKRVMAAAAK
ncbi:MAG: hypothetical protein WAN60_05750 [Candidatus Sulfotelmatobacter sp.]